MHFARLDGSAAITLTDLGQARGDLAGLDPTSGAPRLVYYERLPQLGTGQEQYFHVVLDDLCLAGTSCAPSELGVKGTSIRAALDAAGLLHHTHRDNVTYELAHFAMTSECLAGDATCEPTHLAAQGGVMDSTHGLALDSSGRANIFYRDAEERESYLAVLDEGVSVRHIDGLGRDEVPLALHLDDLDRAHLFVRDMGGPSPPVRYLLLEGLAPSMSVSPSGLCETHVADDGRLYALCAPADGPFVMRGRLVVPVSPSVRRAL